MAVGCCKLRGYDEGLSGRHMSHAESWRPFEMVRFLAIQYPLKTRILLFLKLVEDEWLHFLKMVIFYFRDGFLSKSQAWLLGCIPGWAFFKGNQWTHRRNHRTVLPLNGGLAACYLITLETIGCLTPSEMDGWFLYIREYPLWSFLASSIFDRPQHAKNRVTFDCSGL